MQSKDKKYLIFSDLHGSFNDLKKLSQTVDFNSFTKIFIVGDLYYSGPRNTPTDSYSPKDCFQLLNEYKDQIIAIKGNCDSEVDEMVSEFKFYNHYETSLFGRSVIFTHGHRLEEISGLKQNNNYIFIVGHSHIKGKTVIDGHSFFNPGSLSMPKDNSKSYMILEKRKLTWFNLDTGEVELVEDLS